MDEYAADPLCGGECTIGLAQQMLQGIRENQKPENLKKMLRDVPIFCLSGGEDPVGNRGKGVQKTAEAFREAGMQDVTVTLYPGYRHEMLNEPCKAQVYDDVRHWMETRL